MSCVLSIISQQLLIHKEMACDSQMHFMSRTEMTNSIHIFKSINNFHCYVYLQTDKLPCVNIPAFLCEFLRLDSAMLLDSQMLFFFFFPKGHSPSLSAISYNFIQSH